eukprot:CAMPEP_0172665742 /NCGR_PEP_ID=MMETSP1074-20121228/7427_1 /TAXON_ID=2916 /ORGANISM="Ceratium fusus, Strain PA161109" /LENGTH=46 /DNA_ID= /DNA_START= /DNA_END= /DNA_ORIENTATION=
MNSPPMILLPYPPELKTLGSRGYDIGGPVPLVGLTSLQGTSSVTRT